MVKQIKIKVDAVFCDECGEDIRAYEGYPYVGDGRTDYCIECAYKKGMISKTKYLRMHGMDVTPKEAEQMEIIT